MSHVTGTVQTVAPVLKIGPDFGPSASPNTWAAVSGFATAVFEVMLAM